MTPLHQWLKPLEIASGFVLGSDPTVEPLAPAALDPQAAIEQAILPALTMSPCVVTFSGGRDSSAVLAMTTRLARREGLPDPIPFTNRFPALPDTDESAWQDQIIRHLGIAEWEKPDFDDELDCVGPIATRNLRRNGLTWPFNAHFIIPALEAAKGGALLTGIYGDQVFTPSRFARAGRLLTAKERPHLADIRRLALALSPRRLKRAVLRRRHAFELPWLRQEASQAVLEDWVAEEAEHSLWWSKDLDWWWRRRQLRVSLEVADRLAADANCYLAHPLTDPRFLSALANHGGRAGYSTRTAAMTAAFSDLLPTELLERRSKASFDRAFWSSHSTELVRRWTGDGVDRGLVDIDVLADGWVSDRPDPRTFTLLQSVWLAQHQ